MSSNQEDFNQVFDDKTLNRFLRELMPEASGSFIRNMASDKREDIRAYFRDTLFREGLTEQEMLENWNQALKEARSVQSEPIKPPPRASSDRDRFITPRLGYFPESSKSFRLSDPPLVEQIKRGVVENKNVLLGIASFALLAGLAGMTSSAVLQSKYQNTLADWNQQFGDMIDPYPGPDPGDVVPFYNTDSIKAIASAFNELRKAVVDYDIPGRFKGARDEVALNKKQEEKDKIVNDTIKNYYSNNTQTSPDWLFTDKFQPISGGTKTDTMSFEAQERLALQRQVDSAKKSLSDRLNQNRIKRKREEVAQEVEDLVGLGTNAVQTVTEDVAGTGAVTGSLTGLVTGISAASGAVESAIKIGETSTQILGKTIDSVNKRQKNDIDPTARDRFQGERHALINLPTGGSGFANYLGPGTNVIERIKRQDPPRTPVDEAAMAHDIRYSLAKNIEDLRKADELMIKEINARTDTSMNVFLGKRIIQAKIKAEDYGLLRKDRFATPDFAPPTPDETSLLQKALDDYELLYNNKEPTEPVTQQPVIEQQVAQTAPVQAQPKIVQPAQVQIEPVTQPVVKPVIQPVVEPVIQPVVEPVIQPQVQPVIQPVVEPVIQPVVEPVIQPQVEPAIQPRVEPVTQQQVQPVTAKPNIQQQIQTSKSITDTLSEPFRLPLSTLPATSSLPSMNIPQKRTRGLSPILEQPTFTPDASMNGYPISYYRQNRMNLVTAELR
jgi:hypothetical protein